MQYIAQPKFFPKKVSNSLKYYVELYIILINFMCLRKMKFVSYSSIAKKNCECQESECH